MRTYTQKVRIPAKNLIMRVREAAGLILFSILFSSKVFSQNVGINNTGNAPAASAGLDVSFADKGVLFPRVALTSAVDVTTIPSPATSLIIYNTANAGGAPNTVSPGYYYYTGTAWTRLANGNISVTGWGTSGTPGTTSANFLGTTDAQALYFRTYNTQAMVIDAAGNVGIGASPTFTAAPNIEKFLVDAGTTTSYNVISGKGTINNYLQLNIQNRSAGTGASSDLVATNNLGSETTNFVDLGINSSGNTSTGMLGGSNTGYLYSTGANDFVIGNATTGKDLVFFANGTTAADEKVRIKANGQVGIGSTDFTTGDDAEKVLIDAGADFNTGLNVLGNTDDFYQVIVSNQNSGKNASSDFVVANNYNTGGVSYYVDFGINSTGYELNKSNILNQPHTPYLYSSAPEWFHIGNGYSGKGLVFFTNSGATNNNNTADGFPRMQITSDGNVGIGNYAGSGSSGNTYTVAEKLMVDGNITPKSNNSGTLGTTTYKWNTVYATNGTIQTSDRRLKTNIKPLQYGLTQVLAMKPVTFNWKTEPDKNTKVGLIAQELKQIVPEVVVGDESKENLGVNYSDLVPVLINAVKEQQKRIETQQRLLDKLQAQMDELKKLVPKK